jgi:hypothetical protein
MFCFREGVGVESERDRLVYLLSPFVAPLPLATVIVDVLFVSGTSQR